MSILSCCARALIVALTVAAAATAAYADAGRVPTPKIVIEKGGKCVEDVAVMRRNHMEFLKHQRDDTMRRGIRSTKHSLQQCIDCHASRKTGSVVGSNENFCQSCHAYAAVKLDCFECHSTKPKAAAAAGTAVAKGNP